LKKTTRMSGTVETDGRQIHRNWSMPLLHVAGRLALPVRSSGGGAEQLRVFACIAPSGFGTIILQDRERSGGCFWGYRMWQKLIWAALGVECAVAAVFGSCLWLRHSRSSPPHAQALAPYHASLAPDTSDTLVFVTRTGLWYHQGTCRDVRQSRIPVKLSQVSQYCRPCAKCRPPH
jgi:hypothetical protein